METSLIRAMFRKNGTQNNLYPVEMDPREAWTIAVEVEFVILCFALLIFFLVVCLPNYNYKRGMRDGYNAIPRADGYEEI